MTDAPRPLTTLSEEDRLLRDTVLDFARREVAPHVHAMDAAGVMRKEIVRGLFDLGVMGIEVPDEFGGAGSPLFSAVLVVEALATVDASVSVLVDVQNTLVQNTLLRAATAEQKARYLPRLCSEWVGSYALSEPGSGSDAFALKTFAQKEGTDYVLSGSKLWITNAAESDLFIVFATVDPALGHRGITAFLIERGTPGFSVGEKEDKLGIRASSTCPLVLEDVRLGAEQVLGTVGKGYLEAMHTLNEGRIGIGAQMVGIAQAALDAAVAHTKERRQFGRPLSDFQAVQFQLAQMRTDVELARLLVYNAARMKDAGEPIAEAAAAPLRSPRASHRRPSTCSAAWVSHGSIRSRSSIATPRSEKSTRGRATCSS